MIDKWGTEIALVIATVVGIFVFLVGSLILLSLAMYFGLRLQGVNP
jgi:hypothetical protein